MADGASFDISIEAQALGIDTAAEQLNAFAARIQAANTVATQFDTVVAAANARLSEAAAASRLAADALDVGQAKYKELESAANRASKEVERASLAGKDTTALQAAADAAAAKMREQAAAVDELREKAEAATAAEKKLASSLKTLQGQQSSAAADIKKGIGNELDDVGGKLKDLGGPKTTGGIEEAAESTSGLAEGLGAAASAAAVAAAAVAAVVIGVGALALKAQPGAMAQFNAGLARLTNGFMGLFKALHLEKFLAGFNQLVSFFDEGTSTANGLKKIIEIIFQPIFDAVGYLAPYVKEFFKGIELGVLLAILAVLLLRNKIVSMIPRSVRQDVNDLFASVDWMNVALYAGVAVVGLLVVGLLALAVAMFVAMLPVLLIIGAIALVIAAIMNWDKVVQKISEVWDDFTSAAEDAASDMINGLVQGIKDGAGAVWDAMKAMAEGAIKKFKEVLHISSPSKVFAMAGTFTTQGYVEGIEAGTPQVDSALESMVSVPDGASAGANAAGGAPSSKGASSGGARTIHIESLTVGDSPVAQKNWAELRRMLVDVLEGASITIGGGEAPAT